MLKKNFAFQSPLILNINSPTFISGWPLATTPPREHRASPFGSHRSNHAFTDALVPILNIQPYLSHGNSPKYLSKHKRDCCPVQFQRYGSEENILLYTLRCIKLFSSCMMHHPYFANRAILKCSKTLKLRLPCISVGIIFVNSTSVFFFPPAVDLTKILP